MTHFDNAPRYLHIREVSKRIVFSESQIDRLTQTSDFPKPLYFSTGHRRWHTEDLNAWMQRQINARSSSGWNYGEPILINDNDRFIEKHELLTLVPYAFGHLWNLEKAGLFPHRISIGKRRAVWLQREIIAWLASKRPEETAA